jgi:double-stranded uracil-DNA glycosylase
MVQASVSKRSSDHSQNSVVPDSASFVSTSLVSTSFAVQSFAPIIGDAPTVLILGSMPGVASLQVQRYYAHPRNAFWPMITTLLGAAETIDYQARLNLLMSRGIALWDVLARCERQGSLDSAIELKSAVANPIAELLQQQPSIQVIALNGASAHQLYRKHCAPSLRRAPPVLPMPSTSPANAAISWQQKYQRWAELTGFLR